MRRFLRDLAEAWRAFKAQHWLRDRLTDEHSDYSEPDRRSVEERGRGVPAWNDEAGLAEQCARRKAHREALRDMRRTAPN